MPGWDIFVLLVGLLIYLAGTTSTVAECDQTDSCVACLKQNDSCMWCEDVGACVSMNSSLDISGWGSYNCTEKDSNSTFECIYILTENATNSTPKKLKCVAGKNISLEQECHKSVHKKGHSSNALLLTIIPVISALLGIIAFFLMVFIWIRCIYHRNKRASSDSSPEGTTLTSAPEEIHHKS